MTNIKNTKRALISSVISLFLCFAMLLGTTFAWFTDSVSSENNVIKTGKLKVGFEWAYGTENPAEANWKDASEGAIFDYTNWEPGHTEARHLKVSNLGSLALNYQMRIVANGVVSDLANVIDVYYISEDKALTRDDLADATYLGTLMEVLGTEHHLSKTVYGSLKVNDPSDIHTIFLKLDTNVGNEYQDMDLGCTFSVELIASQMVSEEDNFDNKYDETAPNPAVPAPLVTELKDKNITYIEGMDGETTIPGTLDTAYKFEPTMSYEDVQNSEYKYWHADFVITADKTVTAESMMLVGYYKEWCQWKQDNWVALVAPHDIAAGEEVRLVESMGLMSNKDITVSWEDICEFGNDGIGFLCGATDLTGVNAGTTITVELRLYEVGDKGECSIGYGCNHPYKSCETTNGKVITVGTFTYTFPKVVDGQTDFNSAASQGGTFTLADGNYTMPSVSNQNVTINGTEDTVITVGKPNLGGSNVTFNGVTVNGSGYSTGVQHVNTVTYNDATINGEMCLYGEKVVFNNCTFNLASGQYIWTYGAKNVEFNNCTFNTAGKAILIYNEGAGASHVTVKNCTFNATEGAKAGAIANQNCAAIEIDNFQSSGTGAAHVLVAEGNTYNSFFSGEWRIKNALQGNAITVNGVAYTQIAIDGHLMTIDADKNVTVQ